MPKNSRGKMPKNSKGRNNASDLDLELSDFEVAPMSEHEEISQRSDSDSDQEEEIIQKSLKAANRKGKKSGGFQSMGLSLPVFKAIGHMGYRVPTPIQRKVIPVILDGRDIVAMARTGSGKTAAFLIPLLEKLKVHSGKVGSRGLILSPSRELAMQTLKFCKDLGKHTNLRYCVLVGGEHIDDQFSAIASNPDVIIATPGRLMHLIVEMSLDLKTVEYVVFDEADRLFEMGFAEQLREILFKLPESRQTLLFSATMPKTLVDFARAGLNDPALIRLDVDTKISKDLQMYFLSLKKEQKDALLIYLIKNLIVKDEQAIIFAATKHHVEYLHELLECVGIQNTYIYGALDQQARRIHLARFRSEKEKILIVTDVAARGLDIPLLDHVINYDFPATCKTFVHRVGRVARAGRSGKAWSLVCSDEIPYMLDFQLFSARSLVYASAFEEKGTEPNYTKDIVFGTVADSLIGLELEDVLKNNKENATLASLSTTMDNSYKMYYRSRPTASNESYKRAKDIPLNTLGIFPILLDRIDEVDKARNTFIESLSKFRPTETVFEVGKRGVKSSEAVLMHKRRKQLNGVIETTKELKQERQIKNSLAQEAAIIRTMSSINDEAGLLEFEQINSKKRKSIETDEKNDFRDKDFYMSYKPSDADVEKGYTMQTSDSRTSFMDKANSIAFDLIGDDEDGLKRRKSNLVWDSKKHKFIRPTVGSDNKKMIRTESGGLIPASFKTKRFQEWQNKRKFTLPRTGENELPNAKNLFKSGTVPFGSRKYRHTKITAPDPKSKSFERKQKLRKKAGQSGDSPKATPVTPRKGVRSELKTGHQIQKQRNQKEKRRQKTGRHFLAKNARNKKK